MEKITGLESLKDRIIYLEHLKKTQELELKQEFKIAQTALKPVNLVKTAAKDLFQSTGFKEGILDIGLSLATGNFSKTALLGVLGSPLKKLLGNSLKSFMDKTPEEGEENTIKSKIIHALRGISGKNEAT